LRRSSCYESHRGFSPVNARDRPSVVKGMNENSSQPIGQQSSPTRTIANQHNAKFSTGPRTVPGKAKSCLNSLKHGFFARAVVLPGEDPAAYEALRDLLWSDLNPRNALEALWARDIVDTSWRLQRLGSIETAVFSRREVSFTGATCGAGFAFVNDAQSLGTFTKLSQYEAILTRRLHRAMEEFCRLREKGLGESFSEPVDSAAADSTVPAGCETSASADSAADQPIGGDKRVGAASEGPSATDTPTEQQPAGVADTSKYPDEPLESPAQPPDLESTTDASGEHKEET